MKFEKINITPLIIIGSPRSGTNALRDSLTSLDDFGTWPCDEINGIWKYKNHSSGYDNLSEIDLSEASLKYIRNQFINEWEALGRPKYLVEKTTANSLRPEFVYSIFPNAKYIYIARNGSEVVKSATKRWNGEFEHDLLKYWLDKIKYTPLSDLPYYLLDIGLKRMKNWTNKNKGLLHWGPNHPTIDIYRRSASTQDLAALQWSLCLISSWNFFRRISDDQILFTTYDSYLNKPETVVKGLNYLLGDKIYNERNLQRFSSNILKSSRENLEFFPEEDGIKRYYRLAQTIYKKIECLVDL